MSIIMNKLSSIKYSKYLQLIIDQIKQNDIKDKDKSYICNIINYSYPFNCKKYDSHREKLLKIIVTKLAAQDKKYPDHPPCSSLSKTIGYGSEARINWLESLIKYHKARGN